MTKTLLTACLLLSLLSPSLTLGADPISLFDGESLGLWEPINFGAQGSIFIEDGQIRFDQGDPFTGLKWTGELPSSPDHYEIRLQARKIQGDDFFLALTFPVRDEFCTFVLGGWGGGLVGISSINRMDASENETATVQYFEKDRWYDIRVVVEPGWLSCWIDDAQVVDLNLQGVELSLRPGDIELCLPLGLATYQTCAAYKDISWTPLGD